MFGCWLEKGRPITDIGLMFGCWLEKVTIKIDDVTEKCTFVRVLDGKCETNQN